MHKKPIKIVIAGHVDHGKSTLIGRFLLAANSMSKAKFAEIKKISKNLGKETKLAFLTDQLKEEREQDKTIDTTQVSLRIKNKNFVIIDTPGHVELLKNMITGSTEAESAILLIDAKEGIMEQTKRHICILDMLGIGDKAIFVINKMDMVDYKKERFEILKNELLRFLKNLNITPLFIIPISAERDSNISRKSPDMKWHKGPALLHVIGLLEKKINHGQKPLRFPVQDTYEINGDKIIVGRLESGIIKKSKPLLLLPSNEEASIKIIKIHGKRNPLEAHVGQNIGLVLNKNFHIKRGCILVDKKCRPKLLNSFESNMLWLSDIPLKINKTMSLRCSTQETECMLEKIHKRIDSSTLDIIEENAEELKLNETGLVTFVTKTPILIEKFSFIPELGRFVIEKDYEPMGIGIVI